jgi:hypothetical protein
MKRKRIENADFEKRFGSVKFKRDQLNYLIGGDADGGQGGTNPWPGG